MTSNVSPFAHVLFFVVRMRAVPFFLTHWRIWPSAVTNAAVADAGRTARETPTARRGARSSMSPLIGTCHLNG